MEVATPPHHHFYRLFTDHSFFSSLFVRNRSVPFSTDSSGTHGNLRSSSSHALQICLTVLSELSVSWRCAYRLRASLLRLIEARQSSMANHSPGTNHSTPPQQGGGNPVTTSDTYADMNGEPTALLKTVSALCPRPVQLPIFDEGEPPIPGGQLDLSIFTNSNWDQLGFGFLVDSNSLLNNVDSAQYEILGCYKRITEG